MRLSVLIPYCWNPDEFRLLALNSTLSSIWAQEMRDFELIVVEELVKVGNPNFPYKDRVNQFISLTDPQHRWFNKSWCMNVGLKKAKADNVLVLDADVTFDSDYFRRVLEQISLTPNFFNGYTHLICLPGRDNPSIRTVTHAGLHAVGGAWCCNKNFFFSSLGGMNENYFGYGGEDNDLWYRAEKVLGTLPRLNYTLTHQYHHWHPESGPSPLSPNRGELLRRTRETPVEVTQRLKAAGLGKIESPTLI